MGIAKCPGCGLMVSEDTGTCFACGHPLSVAKKNNVERNRPETEYEPEQVYRAEPV